MNLDFGEIIKRTDLKGTPDELFVDGFRQGVAAGVEEVKNAMHDICFENNDTNNDPTTLILDRCLWMRFKVLIEYVIKDLVYEDCINEYEGHSMQRSGYKKLNEIFEEYEKMRKGEEDV